MLNFIFGCTAWICGYICGLVWHGVTAFTKVFRDDWTPALHNSRVVGLILIGLMVFGMIYLR